MVQRFGEVGENVIIASEAIYLSKAPILRCCYTRRKDDGRKISIAYVCSISSRNTSSSSHLSSASNSSFCAFVSASEAVSNFLRFFW